MTGLEMADLGVHAGLPDWADQEPQSQRLVINSDNMQKDHLPYILGNYNTKKQEIQYIPSMEKGEYPHIVIMLS